MAKSESRTQYAVSRRWTVEEARAALDALGRSGMSVMRFAASEGLDAERLYRWRRHFRAMDAAESMPRFVEVQRGVAAKAPVEVVLCSGRVLRVAESIDAAALRRLATVLEEDFGC